MPTGYNQAFVTYCYGPLDLRVDSIRQVRLVHFGIPMHNEKQKRDYFKKVKASIKEIGLLNPIDVDWHLKEGKIGEFITGIGNDRLQAFRELGRETIPCYIRAHVYKVGSHPHGSSMLEGVCEVLKTVMPFVFLKIGDYYGRVKPYKEWS